MGVRSNEYRVLVVVEHHRIDGHIALAGTGINVLSAKKGIFLIMLQQVRYDILPGWTFLAPLHATRARRIHATRR